MVGDKSLRRYHAFGQITEGWKCPNCGAECTNSYTGIGYQDRLSFGTKSALPSKRRAEINLWEHRSRPDSLYRTHNGLDS